MFGIGGGEWILILVIALLIFGPRKLPEIGRTLGKAMFEFRKASNSMRNTLEADVAEADRQAAQTREVEAQAAPAAAESAATPSRPPGSAG